MSITKWLIFALVAIGVTFTLLDVYMPLDNDVFIELK